MKGVLKLKLIPQSTDLALLVLRLGLGLTLFFEYGIVKLLHFHQLAATEPDPLHVGATINMLLMIFAEVICAAAVTAGVATRPAALILAVEMAVAFFRVHHGAFAHGDLAFIYMSGFVAVTLAGGGRFAVSRKLA